MTTASIPRRQAILRQLRDAAEPVTIAWLAERLDVHVNTVRFHLDALTTDGLAELVAEPTTAAAGPGRPPQRYRAVAAMDPSGPRRYRMLAELLAHGLAADGDGERRAREAGRAWGSAHGGSDIGPVRSSAAAREHLTAMLADFGFAPEPRDPHSLGLRNCPFLDVARTAADVVCPLHLGLMQGTLAAWRAPLDVERLEPFAEPDLCVVHLGPRAATTAERGTEAAT